jgi:Ca-activated chloride channel family protein
VSVNNQNSLGSPILLGLAFLGLIKMASAWLLQQPTVSPTSDDSSFSIKVNVDLVVLNAIVLDEEERSVGHLRREDFSIYEDGVLQELAQFLPAEAPFNLALVLDTSSSVRTNLNVIKKAAIEFTHQLRSADRIGIVEFNASVRQVLDFTSDRGTLRKAISDLAVSRYAGSRVYDGIAQSVYRLRSLSSGRNAIVILSDGLENSSRFKYDGLRILLAQSDAVLFPITILSKERQQDQLEAYIRTHTDSDPYVANARASLAYLTEIYQLQTERLLTLAEDSGGKLLVVSNLADLAGEYSKIAGELRNTYSLAYYSTNSQRDGSFRRLRVEIKDPSRRVRMRSSYFVPRED